MNIGKDLKRMLREVKECIENPMEGLPEEIFLFATQITPMINVDLLVRDKKGRILLSWRDDELCGTGWHVPGGIIRYKEKIGHRIEQVALKELGCKIKYSREPIEIKELICNKSARAHFITLIYDCEVVGELNTENQKYQCDEVGYLAWHEVFPENMIDVHYFYKKYFKEAIKWN